MADDHSSIQVLLIEGPSINNGVPGFIEEEIVCSIPDDIEVIQLNNLPEVNFNKPLIPSKPLLPKKQLAPKAKRKRTAAERAKARANKIQPLITLPEPPADSCIDICGLKVPVKTLLENSDIRKQLAPFIEEIVVSDISDSSDVEEIGKVQRKKAPVIKERNKQIKPPNSKKRKKSPEPKLKEGTGPFVEVLIPDVPDSTELLGEDIIVNLPLAIEKDAIHDTQKMCVLEEQIQLVTDSSDDEPVVEQQNNGMQKKQILFKKVNLVNRSKSNGLVYTKFKNTAEKIPNSQVVVSDDALKENYKCQDNNLDKNNGQEALVMESDDWYYLNIANTPKVDSNSNTKKSTNVNDNSNNEKSTNVNDNSSTAKSTNVDSNTVKSKKFDDNLSMKTPSKVDDNSSMKTSSKVDDNLTVIIISEENDERIKNGSLVESLPVESDQGMPNKESEVETAKPRRRKKRRRIPWSRHAIRGTRVSKYVKAKLQGKIVKGGVKNVINDNQDTTRKSNVMPKKAENADPSSVQKNATNNAPKTSILDKTNPDLDDYILLTCPLCKRKQQKDSTCTKCAHCSCRLVFQCIACGQSFDLRPDLIVHVKCEHYDAHVLTCSSCKNIFFDKHEALTHMKTCGIVPTYYCEFCSFKSKYKHNLTTHIKDKHITMNNGFKCDNCGMEMHNRKGLTKHVFSECPKKLKHKCPKCLYQSYDRSNVVVHIFQNHSSIRENKTS